MRSKIGLTLFSPFFRLCIHYLLPSTSTTPDANVRKAAEAHLEQAQETQYGQFLEALCIEFVTENKPENTRQLAGLCLKNMVAGSSTAIVEAKVARWRACEGTIREAGECVCVCMHIC